MSYRVFSRNERGIGAECPNCKRVLKVAASNLRIVSSGFSSFAAVLCPCGYSSSVIDDPEPIDAPRAAATNAAATKKTSGLEAGCGIIMLLGVVSLFAMCTFGGNSGSSSSRPSDPEILSRNSAWDGSVHWVEKYLKRNLKDPDSYESIEWSEAQKLGNGRWRVRHKYRAKNSFGGYVIENQVFTYDNNGTVYSADDY